MANVPGLTRVAGAGNGCRGGGGEFHPQDINNVQIFLSFLDLKRTHTFGDLN